MTAQRERKQHIRAFMQAHYSDERLAQLLAHAQDGKLVFYSCCCFIGVVTATHALRGRFQSESDFDSREADHMFSARELTGADEAEGAFREMCGGLYGDRDAERGLRILIPMIRAEMKRRATLAARVEVSTIAQRVTESSLAVVAC